MMIGPPPLYSNEEKKNESIVFMEDWEQVDFSDDEDMGEEEETDIKDGRKNNNNLNNSMTNIVIPEGSAEDDDDDDDDGDDDDDDDDDDDSSIETSSLNGLAGNGIGNNSIDGLMDSGDVVLMDSNTTGSDLVQYVSKSSLAASAIAAYSSHDGKQSSFSTEGGSVVSADSATTDDYSFATRDSSIRGSSSAGDGETVKLAAKETQYVRCIRIIVFFILTLLGCTLSLGLYKITTTQEIDDFELNFINYANQIGSTWQSNIERTFSSIDSIALHCIATTTTTTTAASSSSWPFITIPDFEATFQSAQLLSDSILSTQLLPIVTTIERQRYENYTIENQEWIEESLEFQISNQVAIDGSNSNTMEDNSRRTKQMSSSNRNLAQQQQQQQQRYLEKVSFDNGIASNIYQLNPNSIEIRPNPGPFYPIRQVAPIKDDSRTLVNFDMNSNPFLSIDLGFSIRNKEATIGQIFITDLNSIMLTRDNNNNINDNNEEISSVISNTFYPILDDGTERKLVGLLSTFFDWSKLFTNIIPTDINGMICVIKNKCLAAAEGDDDDDDDEKQQREQITFQLNGPDVIVLGIGDLHQTEYNKFEMKFNLNSLNLIPLTTSNIQLLNNDSPTLCQYELSIYPSIEFEETYKSEYPKIYAIGIAIIFFITAMVFCIYDRIVEKRQRKVMKSAMEARAIVSSLFPAVVRDRLFENTREKEDAKKKKKKEKGNDRRGSNEYQDPPDHPPQDITPQIGNMNLEIIPESDAGSDDMEQAPRFGDDGSGANISPKTMKQIMGGLAPPSGSQDEKANKSSSNGKGTNMLHPKHRLKNFLAHGPSTSKSDESDELKLAKPIADLFPHTTVLFADIAGFTAWSSEREPEQVFTLLQTVYHAFDKIAKRRGVFKVETIGDCYVAVTGLPDPQPDHAVRMTKFARECMARMTEVTKKLEVALGPDTGDLCMRLGLHSGPVTAGVLQGEKSRFQLFGDTVNTASRMESTGERNRIQISQSTAELIIEAGKSYWIRPREDLVTAKGKGEVQTYWVVARTGSMLTSGGLSKDGERRAPGRSRSVAVEDPSKRTTKVQRSTSDSLAKMVVKSSSGSSSNEKRKERLIEWQCEMFLRLLKKIVAARGETKIGSNNNTNTTTNNNDNNNNGLQTQNDSTNNYNNDDDQALSPARKRRVMAMQQKSRMDMISETGSRGDSSSVDSIKLPQRKLSVGQQSDRSLANSETSEYIEKTVMDEVAEVITLPKFDPQAIKALADSESIELGDKVASQLSDYIKTIAGMYRFNPFHNFEHASHVTMSANKLLNRIVIPENVDYQRESKAIASDLHDYTYGITSDPLTQFAVVFSALVHDVDHSGVPNAQLAKENPEMARVYRNQSVAEQNSVDLAWELFMDPRYKDLQQCIYSNDDERKRFRQLVVNSVMATDIFDKDMKALRNKRWDKAFHLNNEPLRMMTDEQIDEDSNMKATIVIEHIIQASDVAHTMQHWHIYQKWNERLFEEMYSAYESGRSEKNPADGWFKGELWFFDNYVIPLAKKLEECHVFGVASDECLNYATANRNEWNVKGEEAVRDMLARYQNRKYVSSAMMAARRPTGGGMGSSSGGGGGGAGNSSIKSPRSASSRPTLNSNNLQQHHAPAVRRRSHGQIPSLKGIIE